MDTARGPAAAAMDGDDAACGAFDELRGAVGERSKGIDGLGHDKFSSAYLRDRDLASGKTRRYWPDGRVATSWIFSEIAGFPPAAVVARFTRRGFHRVCRQQPVWFLRRP